MLQSPHLMDSRADCCVGNAWPKAAVFNVSIISSFSLFCWFQNPSWTVQLKTWKEFGLYTLSSVEQLRAEHSKMKAETKPEPGQDNENLRRLPWGGGKKCPGGLQTLEKEKCFIKSGVILAVAFYGSLKRGLGVFNFPTLSLSFPEDTFHFLPSYLYLGCNI